MTNYGSASEMARPKRSPEEGGSGGGGGEATLLSSNINLLNTIIGAGTLAIPLALSHFGILLGGLLIVWCGLTSAFGLYLQSRCARYLERGSSSYFALSQMTYPNAAVFFDAAIAVKCFGVGVSYMIIIGDLMPGVVLGFASDDDSRVPAFLLDRQFWITAFMLFVIPLSFLRRLDSLKYTSMTALVAIGYLVVLVVYHFAADAVPTERGDVNIRWLSWDGPISALGSLPVIIFAYTCHQNMFSVLNEIKDNSPRSVVAVIACSIASAASVYLVVAVTGYLTFGDKVAGNVVLMYAPSLASTIGRAAMVVLVLFSIPLQVHPCRASVDAVLRWRPIKNSTANGHQTPLLPSVQAVSGRRCGNPAAPMGELRFVVLTSLIIMLSYLTLLNVSSLDRVLSYVGSTGSTTISFILPGLFYYKISDPDSVHPQRLAKDDGLMDNSMTGLGPKPRWPWDLEHVETALLRRLALCLAVYGFCVMGTCLIVNTFFVTTGGH